MCISQPIQPRTADGQGSNCLVLRRLHRLSNMATNFTKLQCVIPYLMGSR